MRYIAAFATLVAGAAFVSAAPTCASRQYLDAGALRPALDMPHTDTLTVLCATSCSYRPVQAVPDEHDDLLERDGRHHLVRGCAASRCRLSTLTDASHAPSARGRYLTSTKQCVTGNACPSGTFADSASASFAGSPASLTQLTQPSTATTCKKCYGANVDKCKDATPTGATAWCAVFDLALSNVARSPFALGLRSVSGSCLSSGKCLYIARMLPTTFCSSACVLTSPVVLLLPLARVGSPRRTYHLAAHSLPRWHCHGLSERRESV